MKYLSLIVLTISVLSLHSQDLIQNEFEKGSLANGKRVSVWEYYDQNGDVELKLDYSSGRLVYLKPDSSDFVIYKDGSWKAQKLSIYPIPLEGYYNLERKLKAKIRFPKEALAIRSTGEVVVMFEVDTAGRSADFRIMKDIEGGCGKEVLRVLKEIDPLWITAQVNRKTYRSRFLLRVIFLMDGLTAIEAVTDLPLARVLQPLRVIVVGVERRTSLTALRSSAKLSPQSKFYNMGVAAAEQNNLKEADSLFTLSIRASPTSDALFNRAVTRRNMKDTCGYCRDLHDAILFFSDKEALRRYGEDCAPNADTTYYSSRYIPVDAHSKYRFYEVIKFDKCAKRFFGRVYDAKYTYQAVSSPNGMGLSNLTFIKTNIYCQYYLKDSVKVYTYLHPTPVHVFRGHNRDLVNNQLRQVILTKAPSLKDKGKILLSVTCSGKNNITDVKFSSEELLPSEVLDEIKGTLKILLLNNFEFPEAKLFNKIVSMDFYQLI